VLLVKNGKVGSEADRGEIGEVVPPEPVDADLAKTVEIVPAAPIFVCPAPPESIYDNLPLSNSLSEAERRVAAWERDHRAKWDDKHGKAARKADPFVPCLSA
jgi:hypothetical protein